MATAAQALMTVREFLELPKPTGEYSYELHQGVMVPVTRPRSKHTKRQRRLRDLLKAAAPKTYDAEIEFPFRPLPEHEVRAADVAVFRADRWEATDPEDVFQGAPEIVIEVLSPSNTANEMYEKEQLCLENGCLQFWVVDGKRRQIRVTTAAGQITIYKSGQSIPLVLFGNAELAVDEIFA